MKFEVYCDESAPDALASKGRHSKYLVIGSIWFPAAAREDLKGALKQLTAAHLMGGEFKWQKISPSRFAFYRDAVNWFFNMGTQVRFRAIVVEATKVALAELHDGDAELGFYKFYYQMLHHWISEANEYAIFCDLKRDREVNRLKVLGDCLRNANRFSKVSMVLPLPSEKSLMLQLADLLTGAVAAKFNATTTTSKAKRDVIEAIEGRLGRHIRATGPFEQKFNVFVMDLQGGW